MSKLFLKYLRTDLDINNMDGMNLGLGETRTCLEYDTNGVGICGHEAEVWILRFHGPLEGGRQNLA